VKKLIFLIVITFSLASASARIGEINKEGNLARIYDTSGINTSNYKFLNAGCYVKNVAASAILVKEGNLPRYYDFRGNYVRNTND